MARLYRIDEDIENRRVTNNYLRVIGIIIGFVCTVAIGTVVAVNKINRLSAKTEYLQEVLGAVLSSDSIIDKDELSVAYYEGIWIRKVTLMGIYGEGHLVVAEDADRFASPFIVRAGLECSFNRDTDFLLTYKLVGHTFDGKLIGPSQGNLEINPSSPFYNFDLPGSGGKYVPGEYLSLIHI